MTNGVTLNNPGDIKYNAAVTYSGEGSPATLSTNTGGNLVFDTFDSMADGIRALALVLLTHINRAGGSETVQQSVYDYLGTSTANSENPNVANYVKSVTSASGLNATTVVTKANIGQLISGFLKGEGTLSGVTQAQISQGVSMAGLSNAQTTVATNANNAVNSFQIGAAALASDPLGSLGTLGGIYASDLTGIVSDPMGTATDSVSSLTGAAATVTQAATDTASSAVSGVFSSISAEFFNQSFVARVVLVVLGVILLSAAFFAFTKTNPVEIAKSLPMPIPV